MQGAIGLRDGSFHVNSRALSVKFVYIFPCLPVYLWHYMVQPERMHCTYVRTCVTARAATSKQKKRKINKNNNIK